MRIRQMVVWTVFAAGLAAQESDQGFQWVGLRAGTSSFDPQEYLKAAPLLGGQAGLVFAHKPYGLSLEAFTAHAQSSRFPGKALSHNQVSVTFMTGLLGDSPGGLWPYFGLGLGSTTVAKVTPAPQTLASGMSMAAHASVGFLHRPLRGLIWGVDGRYLVAFTDKGLSAFQGSVLLGFTWGGPQATRRREEPTLPPRAEVPRPQPPPPVVEAAPPVVVVVPPPPPPPVAAPVPMAPAPRPMDAPAPIPASPKVAAPMPPPVPVAVAAPMPKALPPPVPAAPVAVKPSSSTVTERLDALLLGDLAKAVSLGRKRIEAIPANRWTIRLEIANLPATLKHAVGAFPGRAPDLFIAPIKLRDGKTAYQLFLGDYASKAEAERAAKSVPAFFLEGGQRPKAFLAAGIPTQWNQ